VLILRRVQFPLISAFVAPHGRRNRHESIKGKEDGDIAMKV
jgi:hypothetical protein